LHSDCRGVKGLPCTVPYSSWPLFDAPHGYSSSDRRTSDYAPTSFTFTQSRGENNHEVLKHITKKKKAPQTVQRQTIRLIPTHN